MISWSWDSQGYLNLKVMYQQFSPVVLSMLAAEAFITIKVEDQAHRCLIWRYNGKFLSIRLSSSFGVFEDCQEGVRGKQFGVQKGEAGPSECSIWFIHCSDGSDNDFKECKEVI